MTCCNSCMQTVDKHAVDVHIGLHWGSPFHTGMCAWNTHLLPCCAVQGRR